MRPPATSMLFPPHLMVAQKSSCSSPSSVTHTNSSEPTPPPSTFIRPRSFNSITLHGSLVIKSSSVASIDGELFFYRHMPRDIAHLFPRLHWHNETDGHVSFAIDRVFGKTLSTLLVDGKLSDKLLQQVMRCLTELHTSPGDPESVDESLVYASYAGKVAARFSSHKAAYFECGLSQAHFDALLPLLHTYESERRGRDARVIHGDPVLTNVLVATDGSVQLIDMRGAQGALLTLVGDAVYDLGKIVQSLCGYDHILAGVSVDQHVVQDLIRMQAVVRAYSETVYEGVIWKDVLLIVCSLCTSLIPLHDNIRHRKRFARIADVLLTYVREGEKGGDHVVLLIARALDEQSAREGPIRDRPFDALIEAV